MVMKPITFSAAEINEAVKTVKQSRPPDGLDPANVKRDAYRFVLSILGQKAHSRLVGEVAKKLWKHAYHPKSVYRSLTPLRNQPIPKPLRLINNSATVVQVKHISIVLEFADKKFGGDFALLMETMNKTYTLLEMAGGDVKDLRNLIKHQKYAKHVD